jgi:hypothetical protein
MLAPAVTNHYTYCNKVKLIRGGANYFTALHQLIANARFTVYMAVYLLVDDATGLGPTRLKT